MEKQADRMHGRMEQRAKAHMDSPTFTTTGLGLGSGGGSFGSGFSNGPVLVQ